MLLDWAATISIRNGGKKSVNSWYQSKDTIILVVTVVTTVVQYISFNTKLWCATDGTEVFKSKDTPQQLKAH